jgi:cytochrome c oxidase assembly factor CtaG
VLAAIVHAVVLWGWHAPTAFAAAQHDDALHMAMHASFFLAGLVFWAALLRPHRAALGAGVFWLFMTLMHAGFLGALITFAPAPLYGAAHHATPAYGLSPLEDQQLAGVTMWVFSIAVYLGAALALATRWLGAVEKASARQPGARAR